MYRFTVDTGRFSRGRAFHSATAASASRSSASVQRCHIRGAAPCWFTHDRNVLSTAQIVAWTPPVAEQRAGHVAGGRGPVRARSLGIAPRLIGRQSGQCAPPASPGPI